MNNYKIKVNDEAESKEAQELFELLGFKWAGDHPENGWYSHLYAENSTCCYLAPYVWGGLGERFKELTLPQLRDLVVLHRNDVKDATHVDPDGMKYIDLSGTWYWFNDEVTPELPKFGWRESASYREYDDRVLKPIQPEPEQGLISGADALIALIDRKNVQGRLEHQTSWIDLHPEREDFLVNSFLTERNRVGVKCYFRYKPKKVNVEFPATLNREPSPKTPYFYLRPDWEKGFCQTTWEGLPIDKKRFENGIWLLEKDAVSAVAALRGIKG